jgi:hypothetical protein
MAAFDVDQELPQPGEPAVGNAALMQKPDELIDSVTPKLHGAWRVQAVLAVVMPAACVCFDFCDRQRRGGEAEYGRGSGVNVGSVDEPSPSLILKNLKFGKQAIFFAFYPSKMSFEGQPNRPNFPKVLVLYGVLSRNPI